MEEKLERGKKRTLDQVAKDLGVSRGELDRAKKEGVNPYDSTAVKDWKAGRNSYSKGDEPAKGFDEADDETSSLTVERIEELASRPGLTKKDIDVYKGQLDVMKAAAALRVQQGKLISREEVDERDAKIAHALNAMLRRIEKEFPALALGLELKDSAPLIKEKCRQLQTALADGVSEFWKERQSV